MISTNTMLNSTSPGRWCVSSHIIYFYEKS